MVLLTESDPKPEAGRQPAWEPGIFERLVNAGLALVAFALFLVLGISRDAEMPVKPTAPCTSESP